MGGNAFKDSTGEQLAVAIELKYVEPTLDDFLFNHLTPAGVTSYVKIGSTGKKPISGDLDIAVETGGENVKEFKDDLFHSLRQTVGFRNVKKVGQNLAILYPIKGMTSEYVQIDIMPARDIKNTAWLMSGTGAGVRGSWRNTMLSYLAKVVSDSMPRRERITVAFPGGLQRKVMPEPHDPNDRKNVRKWKAVEERITDPQEILNALGVNAKPEDVERYEDLVDVLSYDKRFAPSLGGFKDYALKTSYSKKGKSEAFAYLDSVIDKTNKQLDECFLRKVIQMNIY